MYKPYSSSSNSAAAASPSSSSSSLKLEDVKESSLHSPESIQVDHHQIHHLLHQFHNDPAASTNDTMQTVNISAAAASSSSSMPAAASSSSSSSSSSASTWLDELQSAGLNAAPIQMLDDESKGKELMKTTITNFWLKFHPPIDPTSSVPRVPISEMMDCRIEPYSSSKYSKLGKILSTMWIDPATGEHRCDHYEIAKRIYCHNLLWFHLEDTARTTSKEEFFQLFPLLLASQISAYMSYKNSSLSEQSLCESYILLLKQYLANTNDDELADVLTGIDLEEFRSITSCLARYSVCRIKNLLKIKPCTEANAKTIVHLLACVERPLNIIDIVQSAKHAFSFHLLELCESLREYYSVPGNKSKLDKQCREGKILFETFADYLLDINTYSMKSIEADSNPNLSVAFITSSHMKPWMDLAIERLASGPSDKRGSSNSSGLSEAGEFWARLDSVISIIEDDSSEMKLTMATLTPYFKRYVRSYLLGSNKMTPKSAIWMRYSSAIWKFNTWKSDATWVNINANSLETKWRPEMIKLCQVALKWINEQTCSQVCPVPQALTSLCSIQSVLGDALRNFNHVGALEPFGFTVLKEAGVVDSLSTFTRLQQLFESKSSPVTPKRVSEIRDQMKSKRVFVLANKITDPLEEIYAAVLILRKTIDSHLAINDSSADQVLSPDSIPHSNINVSAAAATAATAATATTASASSLHVNSDHELAASAVLAKSNASSSTPVQNEKIHAPSVVLPSLTAKQQVQVNSSSIPILPPMTPMDYAAAAAAQHAMISAAAAATSTASHNMTVEGTSLPQLAPTVAAVATTTAAANTDDDDDVQFIGMKSVKPKRVIVLSDSDSVTSISSSHSSNNANQSNRFNTDAAAVAANEPNPGEKRKRVSEDANDSNASSVERAPKPPKH